MRKSPDLINDVRWVTFIHVKDGEEIPVGRGFGKKIVDEFSTEWLKRAGFNHVTDKVVVGQLRKRWKEFPKGSIVMLCHKKGRMMVSVGVFKKESK